MRLARSCSLTAVSVKVTMKMRTAVWGAALAALAGLPQDGGSQETVATVADFLGVDDFGRVAEGQRADLVLLNANPLEDIGHFAESAGVMVNGVWLSRSDIDERLAAIEALMEELGG